MESIRLLLTVMLIVTYTVRFIVMSSMKYQRLIRTIVGQILSKPKPFITIGTQKKKK